MVTIPWWGYGLAAAGLIELHRRLTKRQQPVELSRTVEFAGLLAGALAAIVQLQNAAVDTRKNLRRAQAEVSFRLIDKWSERKVATAVAVTERLVKLASKTSPEQMRQHFVTDQRSSQAFQDVLDLLEGFGLAVRKGYADDGILCGYYWAVVERYYGTFKEFIKQQRGRIKQPGAYENFEWLYNNWMHGCPQLT